MHTMCYDFNQRWQYFSITDESQYVESILFHVPIL